MRYRFEAPLWRWAAREPEIWTFVTLPAEASREIRELMGETGRRGFGAVRVTATIGGTTWTTSIFPDSREGAYVLPVKAAVRRAEGCDIGDVVIASVEVRTP